METVELSAIFCEVSRICYIVYIDIELLYSTDGNCRDNPGRGSTLGASNSSPQNPESNYGYLQTMVEDYEEIGGRMELHYLGSGIYYIIRRRHCSV